MQKVSLVALARQRTGLAVGADAWVARTGDLFVVPDARHSLEALEDSRSS
ncbi:MULTISPECIES: hypothetical protein [unclassified Nonomuraea]|nr:MULTISPECIES: hypothetical protein [unclassified Nonomuraea]